MVNCTLLRTDKRNVYDIGRYTFIFLMVYLTTLSPNNVVEWFTPLVLYFGGHEFKS
jgi:hypothetical protein